jgi:hypothetical protein
MLTVYSDAGLLKTIDIAEIISRAPDHRSLQRQKLQVFICHLILLHFLGDVVCDQLFGSKSQKRFKDSRRYLRMDQSPDNSLTQLLRNARLFWLAEALFNLQFRKGIDRVINDIRNGNLQAAWEELQAAAHIVQCQLSVQFLRPNPISGAKTPDLVIPIGEATIYCEVEGKSEVTVPSAKSIRNTLEHARRQLPANRAGIIYLMTPKEWSGTRYRDCVVEAVTAFFSTTNRVVAVLLRAELEVPQDSEVSFAATFVLENDSSPLMNDTIRKVCELLRQPAKTWVTFSFIVERVQHQLMTIGSPAPGATGE